ncbi:unnamed protein product [Choristocarpus tenellus]
MDLSSEKNERARKCWAVAGLGLLFFDSLGAGLFLPVLPWLVSNILLIQGEGGQVEVAVWVGFLVLAYYMGRSGLLWVVRMTRRKPPSLSFVRFAGTLVFSAVAYLICGLVEGSRSLQWLLAIRFCHGLLAGVQHSMGITCLDVAAKSAGTTPSAVLDPIARDAPPTLAGLVVGTTIGGLLFSPGSIHPVISMCLLTACMQLAELGLAVYFWRRRVLSIGYHSNTYRSVGESLEVGGKMNDLDGDLELASWARHGGSVSSGTGRAQEAAFAVRSTTTGKRELDIPARYLRGCGGDEVEAERRWRATLEWRASERVDEILTEAQPYFETIKCYYPHFLHRRARNGCPVYYELLGKIDLGTLRDKGVSPDVLQRHYIFITEYLWGVVEPDFDHGQTVTVLDVAGLGMRDLGGEALSFVKKATQIIQSHYVERSNAMFIINAPSYFSLMWRGIRPLLNERTQDKVTILGGDREKIAATLLERIAPENLPREYGGSCDLSLGESEEEECLHAYVAKLSRESPALGIEELRGKGPGDVASDGVRGDGILPGGSSRRMESSWEDGEEVEVDLHVGRMGDMEGGQSWSVELSEEKGSSGRSKSKRLGMGGGSDDQSGWARSFWWGSTNNSGTQPSSPLGGEARGRGEGRCGGLNQGGAGGGEEGEGRGSAGMRGSRVGGLGGGIGGAVRWAGGALGSFHSRPPRVAHLGQENKFEYDMGLQRWVLRGDEVTRLRALEEKDLPTSCSENQRDEGLVEGGDQELGAQENWQRLERQDSVNSEDLTVLAIQVRRAPQPANVVCMLQCSGLGFF